MKLAEWIFYLAGLAGLAGAGLMVYAMVEVVETPAPPAGAWWCLCTGELAVDFDLASLADEDGLLVRCVGRGRVRVTSGPSAQGTTPRRQDSGWRYVAPGHWTRSIYASSAAILGGPYATRAACAESCAAAAGREQPAGFDLKKHLPLGTSVTRALEAQIQGWLDDQLDAACRTR